MDTPTGTQSARRRVYIAIIFILKLQISSAGDSCPSQDRLNPCVCYRDPKMRAMPQTTALPMEVTTSKLVVGEDILLKQEVSPNLMNEVIPPPELKVPAERRSTEEDRLLKFPKPPSNTTCCTVVACSAPKSLYILEDVIVNALNRKWVDKMILANLPPEKGRTLVRLPSGWLKMMRVKHFEIRDTLLSGDFIHYGSPFEGQEQSMLWFSARNCYLTGSLTYENVGTVNTKGLNYMPRIEGVDFSKNHLVYISNTAFRYPPTNLSTIILSYNSIQGIESSTFHYAPLLKRVDLSHNVLENIYRNIFLSPARNLQNIDLSWNQLKILTTDLFTNMPQLKAVILSNNFLTSLPPQPWSTVWRQLHFVDISNNFVQCDCSLTWLLPILSPPVVNVSTTPAPQALAGQLIFGSCSYIQPNSFSKVHMLTSLTRSFLNCP